MHIQDIYNTYPGVILNPTKLASQISATARMFSQPKPLPSVSFQVSFQAQTNIFVTALVVVALKVFAIPIGSCYLEKKYYRLPTSAPEIQLKI
jgi:hypothetical protein